MEQNQAALAPKVKEVVKLNVAQRYMAKHMQESWKVPHFTQDARMSAEALLTVKNELRDVTFNDILLKVVANTLQVFPTVNSTMDGDQLIVYEDVNISVAIVSERGLFVPVVRNVQKKSVRDISTEVKALAEKAARGRIMPDDMAYGTITVSNLGRTAVESGLPVLNSPQNALVFFGPIRREPVVNENDEVVPGNVITLSNVFDHRVIDGMTASLFTTRLKQEIESLTVEKLI